MRIGIGYIHLGMGQASVSSPTAFVAQAGPTMPANVGAANNIITQQPENNLIISLSQQLGGGVNPISAIPGQLANAVAQYKAVPASSQQALIQPLLALWSFLPSYLANAPIVDAWGQQNGLGGTGLPWGSILSLTYSSSSRRLVSRLRRNPAHPLLVGHRRFRAMRFRSALP